VFRGCADVPFRRIRNDHSVIGGCLDIDIVDADPRPPDDHEFLGSLEQLLIDGRPGPNDQRVRICHCL
jgi:hypothetical protein